MNKKDMEQFIDNAEHKELKTLSKVLYLLIDNRNKKVLDEMFDKETLIVFNPEEIVDQADIVNAATQEDD